MCANYTKWYAERLDCEKNIHNECNNRNIYIYISSIPEYSLIIRLLLVSTNRPLA